MFSENLSAGKLAGECRKLFENKILDTFGIIEVEERACALSKIVVKVLWTTGERNKEALLTFGCAYKSNTNCVGVPWRNNGKWVLIPWNIRGLYQ